MVLRISGRVGRCHFFYRVSVLYDREVVRDTAFSCEIQQREFVARAGHLVDIRERLCPADGEVGDRVELLMR